MKTTLSFTSKNLTFSLCADRNSLYPQANCLASLELLFWPHPCMAMLWVTPRQSGKKQRP